MSDRLDHAGAEARFRLVFAQLGAVTAYARRRGSRDADGIAAEVMAIAWRRLADVPTDDPRPWLFATARALLANNVVVAPKDASENWTPPNPPKVPYAVFADDGGYQWVQAMYKKAAAGDARDLRSSCRANSPG